MTYKELRLKRMAEREAELVEQAQGNHGMDEQLSSVPAESAEPEIPLTEGIVNEATVQETVGNPDEMEDWKSRALTAESRWKTSKVKYDENIFRARQEIKQLRAEVVELQGTIEELQTSKNDPLSQQIVVDTLGEETVNSLQETVKATKETARKMEEERQKSIDDQNYSFFLNRVKDIVGGDFFEVNNDPEFHKFLDHTKTPNGVTYRSLFQSAAESHDSDDVADFFLAFKSQKPTTKPEVVPVEDSVMSHVGPSNSIASQPNGNSEAPMITMAEIKKFQSDMSKGAYKGRHSEMKAMEARIEEAYMANSIR